MLQFFITKIFLGFYDNKLVLQKAYYENTKRKGYNAKVREQHTKAMELSGSRYEELKKIMNIKNQNILNFYLNFKGFA